jgi:hypothetical protein
MAFARRVFTVAGIYGIVVLLPQYFLEDRIGRDNPPPITHAENFYGFIGTALAWQVLFLIIARDPVRYRPAMLPAVLEKLAFSGAAIVLFAQGRLAESVLGFGLVDLAFAVLFTISYVRVGRSPGWGSVDR